MRPAPAGERIDVLDALRGAALFGIIAANMRGFSGPLAAYFDHTVMWTDPTNRVAQAFVDLFIQGKFITLFAFMFGIGFAIQMERADRSSGIASRIFYVRRLSRLLRRCQMHGLWIGLLFNAIAVAVIEIFHPDRSRRARWALWWGCSSPSVFLRAACSMRRRSPYCGKRRGGAGACGRSSLSAEWH